MSPSGEEHLTPMSPSGEEHLTPMSPSGEEHLAPSRLFSGNQHVRPGQHPERVQIRTLLARVDTRCAAG
jgi:hypothetical protein